MSGPTDDTATAPTLVVATIAPTDTVAPDEVVPAARRPTPRQARLGSLAAALAIVLTVTTGILGASWSERRDLLRDYDAAAADLVAAREAYTAADAALAEARGAVRGIAAFIDPVLGLVGEPVPAVAIAELTAAKDAALAAMQDPPPPTAAAVLPAEDPEALANEELLAAAPRLLDAAERLGTATRYRDRLASGAEDIAAGLGTAFVTYADAVIARGTALLGERQDASADSRMALQSALDALRDAATEDVEEIVTSAIAASASVIESSNRVRIDDPNSITVVVNKHRPLQPLDYTPEIVWADVPYGFAPEMRPVTAAALTEMFAAYTAETGGQLLAQSSYRSYDDQVFTYNSCVANLGFTQAERACARPGHSEHQTGLTVDVAAVGTGCLIQECFGDLVPGQWLAANGWRFGFIVRYPSGYEHITGYAYEPWHMRYTGIDVATDMHTRGIATLEEYYGLGAAQSYL